MLRTTLVSSRALRAFALGLITVSTTIIFSTDSADARRYRGKRHETNYGIDPERDAFEMEMGQRAMDSGLPTLGICRGAQMLNVIRGGALIEHIPDEFGESVPHRAPPREAVRHSVQLKRSSRLAAGRGHGSSRYPRVGMIRPGR